MRYDPSFFEGAAVHYRCGRPPYSPRLEALLAEELGLDGGGRLLDVGCGPGILTVRLAHLFEGAVGLEPDPAMIAEGRRAAQERDIANITWIQARAEELPAVAPGPYRLVTFGQSFYWTDEVPVAEAVYDMVEPGGALSSSGIRPRGGPSRRAPGRRTFRTMRSGSWCGSISDRRGERARAPRQFRPSASRTPLPAPGSARHG